MNNNWNVIKLGKVLDVENLIESPPWERGVFTYWNNGNVEYREQEQIDGSLARWMHPKYKESFYIVKATVEDIIKEKLYPTYYYDRFYFKNQELKKHTDRGSCEISVSIHISSNIEYDWPIFFDVNEKEVSSSLKPGEGILYKGIEVPHWRNKLIGDKNSYFHQVFFHYVRANGNYLEHAFDRAKL